jgi:hypothetical protein
MSDNLLRLVPTDPSFIPMQSAIDMALERFKTSFSPDCVVTTNTFEQIQFIDPGSNLEEILCPHCEAEIDTRFWQQAMNNAHRNGFVDLKISPPCCGSTSSLNDLHYLWPAGFARFMLQAHNPGADLDDAQIRAIEQILETPLRKIWAHY